MNTTHPINNRTSYYEADLKGLFFLALIGEYYTHGAKPVAFLSTHFHVG